MLFRSFIQDAWFAHWAQFLLDYPIAFAMLGLAGLFRKNIYLGAVTGSLARFICHFLSGIVFFASYTPEGQSPYIYSMLYNASYLAPDMIICLAVLAVPGFVGSIKRIAAGVGL